MDEIEKTDLFLVYFDKNREIFTGNFGHFTLLTHKFCGHPVFIFFVDDVL